MGPHAARLRAQSLAGPRLASPVAVAERLLAVQAQDPRGFRLALRARSGIASAAAVDAALDAGALVVGWLNRGTLHLVTADDYWWLHALTTPPLFTGNARRLAQEGVPPADADRAVAAVASAVASGPATRAELADRVAAAGVRTAGQALVHVLFLASLRGVAVRGPMAGTQHAYVAARDWLGGPRAFDDRDALLARLAERYLAGHAPANDRDLAKWAGLPLRDARCGLASLRGLVDAGDGLVAPRGWRRSSAVATPVLLGAFDPLLCGWASREPVLGTYDGRVVSGGLYRPFALVGGRGVATWRLDGGRVALEPFAPIDAADRAALDADAERVTAFLARA